MLGSRAGILGLAELERSRFASTVARPKITAKKRALLAKPFTNGQRGLPARAAKQSLLAGLGTEIRHNKLTYMCFT
jgi:hypothetical protein